MKRIFPYFPARATLVLVFELTGTSTKTWDSEAFRNTSHEENERFYVMYMTKRKAIPLIAFTHS